MNVYDEAYNLKRAIQGSEEYKQYMELKTQISKNEHLDKMLKDFQQKQFSIQTKQMSGEEITDDMMKQFQDLYAIIVRDPKAAEYIQCELRFSVMMNDVYKILGEAVLTEKERQEAKARKENAAAEVQKASETDDKGKAD